MNGMLFGVKLNNMSLTLTCAMLDTAGVGWVRTDLPLVSRGGNTRQLGLESYRRLGNSGDMILNYWREGASSTMKCDGFAQAVITQEPCTTTTN